MAKTRLTPFKYKDYDIEDALDGLFAYSQGFTDSGIRDDGLRDYLRGYLFDLEEYQRNVLLSNFIKEYYLTDDGIMLGYGIASVAEFIRWLDEEIGLRP